MFRVGVGEGEVLGNGFGGYGGGEEIRVFKLRAVEGAAGAEGVDKLGDVGVDAGVEVVQVGVCVGCRYVDELAGLGGGEGNFCYGEGGRDYGSRNRGQRTLEVYGRGSVDVDCCCRLDLRQLVFRKTQPRLLDVAIEDFDLVFVPDGFILVGW